MRVHPAPPTDYSVYFISDSVSPLGSERSENLVLLVGSLETTVANLGGSINEFNIDCLGLPRLGGWEDRLSESDRSLSGTLDTALD